jgi:TfoX/Sxy family transcriptional regulator of competence genes
MKPEPRVLDKTELLEVFDRAIHGWDGVSTRKMFGFPCAFHNDQMFLYVYHDGLVLRLSESDRQASLELGATPFVPKGGRGMREYVVMPEVIVCDKAQLEPWIAKSFAFVHGLPAKTSPAKPKGASSRRTP